jgi:hypothetical protein
MTDIPLHSFRRLRKFESGYTPLSTGQDDGDDESEGTLKTPVSASSNSMPSITSRAAVISASRKHENSDSKSKGKRRQRYVEDLEEQVNLLEDERDEYGHDDEDGEDTRAHGSTTTSKAR